MIPDCYYIVCDFGKNGRETVIDWERCSKADIIRKLCEGQLPYPSEVHMIDRNDGRWADASEDIAREIVQQIDSVPPTETWAFLERHLGADYMEQIRLENQARWAA